MDIVIRPAEQADTHECGRICYDAFRIVNERHGFPSVFPSLEIATRRVAGFIRHPSIFAVVAEDGDRNGKIIGFNFPSERDPMRAIGPIAVDPAAHGSGIGRRLMEAVLERARGARSIRLLQETYNVQSLSLYAALGFDPRELFVVMAGVPRGGPLLSDWQIRYLTTADLPECEALHERLRGIRAPVSCATQWRQEHQSQSSATVASVPTWRCRRVGYRITALAKAKTTCGCS